MDTHATALTSESDALLSRPNWAVTLFSFTNELVLGADPNGIIEQLAVSGATTRIEVDSFQHFASFPRVSDAEAGEFRDLAERLDLELTELGIYNDTAVRGDELRSVDEQVAALAVQIDSAARLGFPAVKIMFGMDAAVLEGLLPTLERHSIPLYQEVQAPVRIDSPELDRQRENVARMGNGLLGFVFDLSACMGRVPVTYLEALRRDGVPEEAIRLIDEEWPVDTTGRVRDAIAAVTDGVPLAPLTRVRLAAPYTRFGTAPVSEFRDFLPEVNIVHLKFWDLEDDDARVSRPIADLRRELGAIGFTGAMTSEYGGHEWLDIEDHDGLTMTLAHRELYDRAVPV